MMGLGKGDSGYKYGHFWYLCYYFWGVNKDIPKKKKHLTLLSDHPPPPHHHQKKRANHDVFHPQKLVGCNCKLRILFSKLMRYFHPVKKLCATQNWIISPQKNRRLTKNHRNQVRSCKIVKPEHAHTVQTHPPTPQKESFFFFVGLYI